MPSEPRPLTEWDFDIPKDNRFHDPLKVGAAPAGQGEPNLREVAVFLCDLFHARTVQSRINGVNGIAAIFAEEKQIAVAEELLNRLLGQAARSAPSPAPRWIPVEEKLPEFGERVLLLHKMQMIYLAERQPWPSDDSWVWRDTREYFCEPAQVTHWMPLPAAPVSAGPEEKK